MAVLPIRARWLTASRGPRVAAALAAALLLGSLTGAARQPAPSYPVQAEPRPTARPTRPR